MAVSLPSWAHSRRLRRPRRSGVDNKATPRLAYGLWIMGATRSRDENGKDNIVQWWRVISYTFSSGPCMNCSRTVTLAAPQFGGEPHLKDIQAGIPRQFVLFRSPSSLISADVTWSVAKNPALPSIARISAADPSTFSPTVRAYRPI